MANCGCNAVPCCCPGSVRASLSRAARAQRVRRRRERAYLRAVDPLVRFSRENIVRVTHVDFVYGDPPKLILPENPYRTAIHFYTPVFGGQIDLFLHSTGSTDIATSGIYYVFPDNEADELDIDCHCQTRRFISSAWSAVDASPSFSDARLYIHEVLSVPEGGPRP